MEDNRFLGLLYAILAVGCMYNIAEEDIDNQVNYKEATEEGYVISHEKPPDDVDVY